MITRSQIEELAADFKIDQTSIFREYLQLQFLNYLYQQPKAEHVYFKGGTAIHLLLNSPRFSEDLDFAANFPKHDIKILVKAAGKEIARELPDFKISFYYQGEKSIRFRIKYQSGDFKYPFVIRLDFTEKEAPLNKVISSSLVTKFPITLFPIVKHLSPEEILAEKIRAFLARGKGRDVFDIWFLLEKKVPFQLQLIDKKMAEVGKRYSQPVLIEKISRFSQKKLDRDLNKFLPQPHRKISFTLRKELLVKIKQLTSN